MGKRIVAAGVVALGALAFLLGGAAAKDDPMAEMQEWLKLGSPGKEHAELAKLAGKWHVKSTWWPAAGALGQESAGTAEYTAIYGGRYVTQAYEGNSPMGTFHGQSILGYDNAAKQYFATWIDSMSTGIAILRGTGDASGKVVTMTGEMIGPGGKLLQWRSVSTTVDENTHTFEMYESKGDAPEYKSMEMVYTRAK
jgi:hypothetical protein